MSRYRKITTICCAAVFALGLAACGGGGDDGLNTSQEQELQNQKEAAENQVAALTMQINALRAQLGLDPADDLGDSVSGLQQQVADLQKQVQDAADAEAAAEAEAMRKQMAADGKALHGALGDDPLAQITDTSLTAAGFMVTTAADSDAEPRQKAGDSAGMVAGWNGMHYVDTNAGTKVVNHAVVYTNRGPGKSLTFADAGYIVEAEAGDNKGYLTTVDPTLAMADAFMHSGQQTHAIPERSDALYVRGTYDGAPGEFRCTDAAPCLSTNDGKGSPSGLTGTWHFKPDAGAMVSRPDPSYLYYGWWLRKDKDGIAEMASAFHGVGGTEEIAALTVKPNVLTGSATYSGGAAGKFAINNPLGGSDAGHFTADVELTAKFGAITPDANNGGISGMVTNFMANDKAVPWSVELQHTPWTAASDAFMTAADDVQGTKDDESKGTVWSIDGNAAPESGKWSGQMYDEMPGGAPSGDGSTVPTTVTGKFQSMFGSTHTMVGAFGANKQ